MTWRKPGSTYAISVFGIDGLLGEFKVTSGICCTTLLLEFLFSLTKGLATNRAQMSKSLFFLRSLLLGMVEGRDFCCATVHTITL